MKRNLLQTILFAGILIFIGATAANSQNNLFGKYSLEQKFANGQTQQISFELKTGNVAIYSKINAALEELTEKTGSWTWDKSKKLLIVIIPAEGVESEVAVTFKMNGKNLKVVKVSPEQTGKIGDVFKKI